MKPKCQRISQKMKGSFVQLENDAVIKYMYKKLKFTHNY